MLCVYIHLLLIRDTLIRKRFFFLRRIWSTQSAALDLWLSVLRFWKRACKQLSPESCDMMREARLCILFQRVHWNLLPKVKWGHKVAIDKQRQKPNKLESKSEADKEVKDRHRQSEWQWNVSAAKKHHGCIQSKKHLDQANANSRGKIIHARFFSCYMTDIFYIKPRHLRCSSRVTAD